MTTRDRLPADRIAALLVTALDGPHRWGSVAGWSDRRGHHHVRVTIYPPAITAPRRRLLRLWFAWPGVAAALLLPVLVVGHAAGSVRGAFLVAATAYAAGGIVLARRLRSERRSTRIHWFVDGEGRDEWRPLVDRMCRAEIAADRGRLSDHDFQAVWSDAYRSLAAGRRVG